MVSDSPRRPPEIRHNESFPMAVSNECVHGVFGYGEKGEPKKFQVHINIEVN